VQLGARTGRGRRLGRELRAEIRRAIRTGKRGRTIAREFVVDEKTVWILRREMGDMVNRKGWAQLPKDAPARMLEAELALRRGRRWRDAAADAGVALATLQRYVSYRKRGSA
jgi:hypothetical protein